MRPTIPPRSRVTTPFAISASGPVSDWRSCGCIIGDGVHPPLTFEFDSSNNGVAPGSVAINLYSCSSCDEADEVAPQLVPLINGLLSFDMNATSSGAVVVLTNDHFGSSGNILIDETVVDSDFLVSGMAGGAGADCTTGLGCATNNDCAPGLQCVGAAPGAMSCIAP